MLCNVPVWSICNAVGHAFLDQGSGMVTSQPCIATRFEQSFTTQQNYTFEPWIFFFPTNFKGCSKQGEH